MDQARIGKFIAEMRKAKRLTQRQLADALAISDKTVSKWECGKGLPEVSLMLPLCEALEITVNDLLSGERVSGTDYQRKAEENMVDLVRENQENRRRLALSAVCAGITAVAVGALIVIASLRPPPREPARPRRSTSGRASTNARTARRGSFPPCANTSGAFTR